MIDANDSAFVRTILCAWLFIVMNERRRCQQFRKSLASHILLIRSRHSLVPLECNFFASRKLLSLIHVAVRDKSIRPDHWTQFNADEGLQIANDRHDVFGAAVERQLG